jgi:hypothetical protein
MQSKLVAATFHGGSDSASLILIAKNWLTHLAATPPKAAPPMLIANLMQWNQYCHGVAELGEATSNIAAALPLDGSNRSY